MIIAHLISIIIWCWIIYYFGKETLRMRKERKEIERRLKK
jgi:hypothetical protein